MKKWISIIATLSITGLAVVLLSVGLIRSQVQEIAGLAVAQTATRWNSLRDAAAGDNLTSGIGVFAPYVFDGTNFDAVRGDTTYGMDVDVTRVSGNVNMVGTKTPADNYANPTDAINSFSLLGIFDGTTWDRALASVHGDDLTTSQGLNTASFSYVFDGTNWDRVRSNVSPAPTGNLVIGNSYTVNTVLLASAARTANGDSGALTGYGNFRSGIIQLNVTAQSGTTPTLDVYIDTTTDGTNWINIAHFTQFGAATGRRIIQLNENTAGSTSDIDATGDLAAGTVRQGPWGSTLRVRWVITGGTPSYTFGVTGTFKS